MRNSKKYRATPFFSPFLHSRSSAFSQLEYLIVERGAINRILFPRPNTLPSLPLPLFQFYLLRGIKFSPLEQRFPPPGNLKSFIDFIICNGNFPLLLPPTVSFQQNLSLRDSCRTLMFRSMDYFFNTIRDFETRVRVPKQLPLL